MTASQDHTARIWNAETGAPITESLRHADRMLDACFSPDGLRIATASKDNTAKVWDARTGKLVGRPLRHLRTVQSVAFSPDGRQILTASLDHTARLWDALTSEPLTSPLEHDEGVWNAVFSPDGKRIVTAAGDGTARLWDAKSGLPLSDPLVHPGTVRMARFSSDGQRLATVTQAPDAATRIWQVPEAALPIPAWLPELAEAVAGLAMGPHGTTRLISENEFAELKERAASFDGQGAFHRLARWMFADRNSRTISPFQSETVSEYVQRRIAENTSASLEEAVLLDPANGIALARLAAAVAPTNPEEDPRRAAEARHLAKRALQFSPDLPEAQKVLDRMSH
jgi:dipeptidyl aminopeptidase/acylaminoacyl peptidase